MRKKFSVRTDIIEAKKKVFVYINKKNNVKVTEEEVRKEANVPNLGALKVSNEKLFVFDLGDGIVEKKTHFKQAVENFQKEEVGMTDLTLSYGASELEPAPLEITNPQQEQVEEKPVQPKPTRRRRTRKSTKTTETSE